MLDDKIEFNQIFSDFLGREWIDLRKTDEESFNVFIKNHKIVFAKPTTQFGGKGILRIETDSIDNPSALYEQLISEKKYDVEQQIVQHHKMNLLSDSSVNSLRITTLLVEDTVHVLYSLVRISDGHSFVDNISSGGMYCPIDALGKISADAFCDSKITYFNRHPETNTVFKGFEIPYFAEAIALVTEAALRVIEIRYIGWDVAITENGPVLIEGNVIPGYDMPQNYKHLELPKEGILEKVKAILDLRV